VVAKDYLYLVISREEKFMFKEVTEQIDVTITQGKELALLKYTGTLALPFTEQMFWG
jgi:hypothetical protein